MATHDPSLGEVELVGGNDSTQFSCGNTAVDEDDAPHVVCFDDNTFGVDFSLHANGFDIRPDTCSRDCLYKSGSGGGTGGSHCEPAV